MDANNRNGSGSGSGTTQACAACKYQRRKCGPNCILAPYFPHHRQKQFLNAHKLFGVGKITNMAKAVSAELRDETMTSIIYQADMRASNPVGGCLAVIQLLESWINRLSMELRFTLKQLAVLKASPHFNNNNNNNMDPAATASIPFPAPLGHHHYFDHSGNQVQQIPQHVLDERSQVPHHVVEPCNEIIEAWANYIPFPLDKKETGIGNDDGGENNDQKPVLDLINELNLDSSRSSIDG